MGMPTSFDDEIPLMVLDASAVINVSATGYSKQIVRAFSNRLVIVDIVYKELEVGRARGWPDVDLVDELVADGLIEIVRLDDAALAHFESLVIGPALTTLDDSEAATIAYANESRITAVIDEKKVTQVATERFPGLQIYTTAELLTRPPVKGSLGDENLAEAVFHALVKARMPVDHRLRPLIAELVGSERAAICSNILSIGALPDQRSNS